MLDIIGVVVVTGRDVGARAVGDGDDISAVPGTGTVLVDRGDRFRCVDVEGVTAEIAVR